jgi:sugar lactone lactonase YvrE
MEETERDRMHTALQQSGVHMGASLQVLEIIGGPGTGPGEFGRPLGSHLDFHGTVYVADGQDKSVRKISAEGDVWTYSCAAGDRRTDAEEPYDVSVDSRGMIYILDRGGRIQKVSTDAGYQLTFGMPGTRRGQLRFPEGLVLDSQNNVYVADTWNHRISIYHPKGAFRAVWRGEGIDGFERPGGVGITRGDEIIVCDTFNHRLVIYNPSGVVMDVIDGYREPGWVFRLPVDVAEDPFGNLWVAQRDSGTAVKVARDGSWMANFGPELPGNLGRLERIASVSVHRDGDIYLCDEGTRRVLKVGYRD